MWCISFKETEEWARNRSYGTDTTAARNVIAENFSATIYLSNLALSQQTYFCEFLTTFLGPFDECLLWVTQTGVWPSSENWHLFYRLRESYGEKRQLSDAPGHLFLKHELADIASFIQLCLICGWDIYLLTWPHYQNVFISHDEYVDLYAEKHQNLEEAAAAHPSYKIELK